MTLKKRGGIPTSIPHLQRKPRPGLSFAFALTLTRRLRVPLSPQGRGKKWMARGGKGEGKRSAARRGKGREEKQLQPVRTFKAEEKKGWRMGKWMIGTYCHAS